MGALRHEQARASVPYATLRAQGQQRSWADWYDPSTGMSAMELMPVEGLQSIPVAADPTAWEQSRMKGSPQ